MAKVVIISDVHQSPYICDLMEAVESLGHQASVLAADANLADGLASERADVCLVACTGRDRRSGNVQELLDLMDLPYVGSPARVCRRSADRTQVVEALEDAAQVETMSALAPATFVLSRPMLEGLGGQAVIESLETQFSGGFPLCVKPAHGAGKRGSRKADDVESLRAALEDVWKYDSVALVQEWIDGVELIVTCMGDVSDLLVLPAVEVDRTSGEVTYHVPVRPQSLHGDSVTAEDIRSTVERAAYEAFVLAGCRDYARVDIVWDGARAYVVDIDVAPGFQKDSVAMLALDAAGVSFSEMLDEVIDLAIDSE